MIYMIYIYAHKHFIRPCVMANGTVMRNTFNRFSTAYAIALLGVTGPLPADLSFPFLLIHDRE